MRPVSQRGGRRKAPRAAGGDCGANLYPIIKDGDRRAGFCRTGERWPRVVG